MILFHDPPKISLGVPTSTVLRAYIILELTNRELHTWKRLKSICCMSYNTSKWWNFCCCSIANHIHLFVTPWTAVCQASLSFFQYLPRFAQIHVHWVGDATQPVISSSAALFSFCLQSFLASGSFPMNSSLHHGHSPVMVKGLA